MVRLRLKCNGTSAENRFRLSAKRTSPFKSAGASFHRLLTTELCVSAVVMLDTPCSELVWRVLATHSIRQFPLQFPSRASTCTITFQLDSTVFPAWYNDKMFSYMVATVTARCRAWGFQPLACRNCEFHWGHRCLTLVLVVCCQAVASASSWFPVQTSPTECCVSECDRENWLNLIQYTTDLLNTNSIFPVHSGKKHKNFDDERDFT